MFLFKQHPKKQIGFEDIKIAIKDPDRYILINTLPRIEQDVLIYNTVSIEHEEKIINIQLNDYNIPDIPVIVYGRNSCDTSAELKQKQLRSLGIVDVYIYPGGLFEWLLLQDAYGDDEFPSTNNVPSDTLRYRVKSTFTK